MATVTYKHPVSGATPPTAAQVFGFNQVIAEVDIALYDTTITLTHNMNISTADLAAGYPRVQIEFDSLPAQQEKPFVATKTANTVVLTVADFGHGTIVAPMTVTIERPASWTK